jgi:outer membrane protein OmpA-like peptidoglycan-associated protein
MNRMNLAIVALLIVGGAACMSRTVSKELVEARVAYHRASQGNAAKLVPAELLVARRSLQTAEYESVEDSQSARDVAYVATRKAQRAEALGNAAAANAQAVAAERERARLNDKIIANQRGELAASEGQLAQREGELAQKQGELAQKQSELTQKQGELTQSQQAAEAERLARLEAEKKATEAEKKATDAMDALRRQLAIKDDTRGTVITISGGVLFATGKSAILPGARTQLDQVANALKIQAERSFTIEGHTDDRGSDSVNANLSKSRANAVRDYLISRGVSANAISAVGIGETRPVGDNRSVEGRAMNRRVEIVVGQATARAAN